MAERRIFGSWKEIAEYLGRDVRTCQRYERELGLPVHRLDESAKARVFAYRDEIDAWRDRRLQEDAAARNKALLKARPLVFAALTILAIALGSFLIRHFSAGRSEKGKRPALAILPFESPSGGEVLRSWADVVPRLLIQNLSRSKHFDVIGDDRINGVLRDLGLDAGPAFSTADLEKIARSAAATHTVTGAVMKTGDTFIISLTVRRPGRGGSYPSRYEYGSESALVKAIDRMAVQIKTDLGLTRSQLAGDYDATEVEVTTASFEAFRLYNEGRRLHLAGDFAESSRIMRKALEIDPEFALAWRSLAMSLGPTEPEETAACLEKALEFSRKASEKEQLWIKVDYFESRAEYGKALEACRQWASRFPNDGHALLLTGRQHLKMEDPESAQIILQKSLQTGDTNPYTFYWAACALRLSGKAAEADRLCERALSIHPGNMLMIEAGVENDLARASFDRALRRAQRDLAPGQNARLGALAGDILLLKSDFAGAGAHYQALGPDTRLVQARLARLALAEGRYGRAADLAGRAKDHVLLAHIEARTGRSKEGSEEAGLALAEAERSGHLLRQLEALQAKGLLETRQGDLPAAAATLSRLRDLKSEGVLKAWERHVRFLEGLVGSLSGRSGQAGADLEAAVGLLPGESGELGFDDHSLYLYFAAREREKAGRDEAAAGFFRRLLSLQTGRLRHPDLYALSHFALGRIAEARSDAAGARQYYERFLDLWKNADEGLPEVAEAKMRLAALDRQL